MGWEDPLEEALATHPSILAWRIPWTEEPDGLAWGCKESDTTEATKHNTAHICVYIIYIMEYYPAIKKNEIVPFSGPRDYDNK